MANARTPGPQGTTGTATQRVADGTHGQFASPAPGTQTSPRFVFLGPTVPGLVASASLYALQYYYRANMDCMARAYAIGLQGAPAAVLKETGLDDLPKLLGNLLKGLLVALISLAASAALGAAIGGVIGFFLGGVGAVPGAAAGASVGLEVGMAILTWMGLAILGTCIVKGLGELAAMLTTGVQMAWNAADASPAQREAQIAAAGEHFSRAVGTLVRLIIEGLVVYVTKGDATKTAARAGEMVQTLRKSRLGEGFATWFEVNWAKLASNPRFNPALRAAKNESRSAESAGTAQTPSAAAGRKAAEPEPPKPPKKGKPTFDEVYGKAPEAKKEIDGMADELAAKYDGTVAKAPIKSQARALEKINNDYGGDPTRIKDLARNTIVVEGDKVGAVAADLEAAGAKVKTISATTDELGYSGVNATIQTKAGIPAEIQVNSPEMIFAKETPANARAILGDATYDKIAAQSPVEGGLGHAYYEQWRVLDPSSPAAKSIAEQSRQYYDLVRK